MAWIFTENDCKSATVDIMRIPRRKCLYMLGHESQDVVGEKIFEKSLRFLIL